MADQPTPQDRFIRLPEVTQLTGISSSSIYRWIAKDAFPKQVKLSAYTSAWRLSEVTAWMESREAA